MSRGGWLWVAAAAMTLAAAVWQWRSGPEYPYRGAVAFGATRVAVTLPRSHATTAGARIAVPAPAGDPGGTLWWRPSGSAGAFAPIPLRREGESFAAALPTAPPAGRIEYFVEVRSGAGVVRVPARRDETVVLRYHGPVPAAILVPHITVMFLSILLGVRAGLAALTSGAAPRGLTLATLALLTAGGLVLGPATQRLAFGAWWTGVPLGWDLTDNKTLLMWIGWALAAWAVLRRRADARRLVVFAATLMLAVYLVPHSLNGSRLDRASAPTVPAP